MAAKKSSDDKTKTKRPTISSSHTTLRAPKAEKPSKADPRTPAKGRTPRAEETARPKASPSASAKKKAVEAPASKPIPKATTKSALQIAATKGKKANPKASLPVPAERKDESKRKARVRSADEVDPAKVARERALQIAAAGLEKKAIDVAIIDVYGKVDYADFLVLMTGTSDRHVASIVQGVEDDQRKRGERALSVEGLPIANWVLVDFADVVVHVFQEHARGSYDLDGLWMDATRVPFAPGGGKLAAARVIVAGCSFAGGDGLRQHQIAGAHRGAGLAASDLRAAGLARTDATAVAAARQHVAAHAADLRLARRTARRRRVARQRIDERALGAGAGAALGETSERCALARSLGGPVG